MLRITVLISGGGTNLQALIDRIADGTICDARIESVISSDPKAYGLVRAEKAGIPAAAVVPGDFRKREDFEKALIGKVQESSPGLIVLAGYLVRIPAEMIRLYPRRIINIHPSLIPSFCGKGYYGRKVHEAALARGVKVTGATVHYVNEELDGGPILKQKAVEIPDGITAEELQKLVMKEAEWVILPQAVAEIASSGKERQ